MGKSSVPSALSSAFAGTMLALVLMFSANALTTQVRAEEDDYWCNATPPIGCNVFGCFVRGDGVRKCKFIASQNGADCTTTISCVKAPGGGGILIE